MQRIYLAMGYTVQVINSPDISLRPVYCKNTVFLYATRFSVFRSFDKLSPERQT